MILVIVHYCWKIQLTHFIEVKKKYEVHFRQFQILLISYSIWKCLFLVLFSIAWVWFQKLVLGLQCFWVAKWEIAIYHSILGKHTVWCKKTIGSKKFPCLLKFVANFWKGNFLIDHLFEMLWHLYMLPSSQELYWVMYFQLTINYLKKIVWSGLCLWNQPKVGWCAEFLIRINLNFLLGKTGARLNLKIDLIFLHFGLRAFIKL
jgi:hypothetical protein